MQTGARCINQMKNSSSICAKINGVLEMEIPINTHFILHSAPASCVIPAFCLENSFRDAPFILSVLEMLWAAKWMSCSSWVVSASYFSLFYLILPDSWISHKVRGGLSLNIWQGEKIHELIIFYEVAVCCIEIEIRDFHSPNSWASLFAWRLYCSIATISCRM